jgi:hypothetical protein
MANGRCGVARLAARPEKGRRVLRVSGSILGAVSIGVWPVGWRVCGRAQGAASSGASAARLEARVGVGSWASGCSWRV